MTELVNSTVGKLLETTATVYGEREAVVYPELNLRYTYKEFEKLCRDAAKGFMSLGIDKGEHVAIWASNKPEWLISQFATAKMGAVLVTVNTSYRTNELEYLLSQSDASTIILMDHFKDHSFIDTLYEIVPELTDAAPGQLKSSKLPHLRNIIVLGDSTYPGTVSWKELLAAKDQ